MVAGTPQGHFVLKDLSFTGGIVPSVGIEPTTDKDLVVSLVPSTEGGQLGVTVGTNQPQIC